jgi:hypothetical protein
MSKEQNAKKSKQLGMPFGTASGRLRKMLLFKLAKELGYDVCYRCQLQISDIENFTIEHKKAWLDVDPNLFWDLDNIAFSHLACNVGARRGIKAVVCFKCKINPPRRSGDGFAKECTECNTQAKQIWRSQVGRNLNTVFRRKTADQIRLVNVRGRNSVVMGC